MSERREDKGNERLRAQFERRERCGSSPYVCIPGPPITRLRVGEIAQGDRLVLNVAPVPWWWLALGLALGFCLGFAASGLA